MNKNLFVKVKDKCKDTGLSEKYLIAITEKMGGSIEDDSTDEAEIEKVANLIAEVAKESQGEASRWANKKKAEPKKKKAEDEDEEEDEDEDNEGNDKPQKANKKKGAATDFDKKLQELQDEIKSLKSEKTKSERAKEIATAMEKHKIPSKFRERLAKTITDEEDIEEAVAAIKQDFITDGLMSESAEGSKAASEKQVGEAASSLLETITVK